MTISIWRYSHLALAVSSFLLLTLASLTGVVLSFQPLSEKLYSYRADKFDEITLAQSLPVLKQTYPEINALSVDANQFVQIKGTDANGEKLVAYIDPVTGKILGHPEKKSEFFEWVTALHRSLFLHEAGRFFVGLTAFLLLLISISGTILIVQRQRGWKRFFTRIVRDNFAQYYHVVLGRLSLIPICILALTGTYLSLNRFGLTETPQISAKIDFDAIQSKPERKTADFDIFKGIKLSQVQTIEFPFSEDVEDYYTLKLRDREVTVNQITGEVLSEVKYPATALLTEFSLDLHTGRASALWAIVLAVASGNILFFIYSGFIIMFRRRRNRAKNKYTAQESEFIILVGSENGSTFGFANAVYQQLITGGKTAYMTELNDYAVFPKASHIIIMTATYGLGDAPTNAGRFALLLAKYPQEQSVQFSVIGFGSHSYPDFCKFAFEIDNLLSKEKWAVPMLEIHTVHDKSPHEFGEWITTWSQHADIPLVVSSELLPARQEKAQSLTVIDKTAVFQPGEDFLIRLRPKNRVKFTSGDLLAIYPANDHRERLYSIGKVGKDIQLSVKLHDKGLGSDYLYRQDSGTIITNARIVVNAHFHFPAQTAPVIMISNGTGIAPFLGMIDQRRPGTDCYLYCGFRDQKSFSVYRQALDNNLEENKLGGLQVAYSREGEKQYVKDLLFRDEAFVADVLAKEGVVMLCGSLSMQKDVVNLLENICQNHLKRSVSYYQSRSQVVMDCY
ncbi:PepSY domain-containing protein [Dyadobacter sp. LHD-138]|uniref:PepSY domain-containing protein n=1 Tax=Dyadobacter sp. LHD-138 TaxID=3071413 RepID=UPI0027DFDDC6|nr:PepSY domain-containing protein [Dyadobacter sp. LHD-138]MDQ6479412.1 PepSY domain-containing protein [Dyadobacter sp. LHD-138]